MTWIVTLLNAQACTTLDSALDYILDDGWLFFGEQPRVVRTEQHDIIWFPDTRATLTQKDFGIIRILSHPPCVIRQSVVSL